MHRKKHISMLLALMVGLGAAVPGAYAETPPSNPVDQAYAAASEKHKAGKFAEAITLYTQVLKLKPDHGESLWNRGNIYLNEKQYALAEADYRQVVKLAPEFADAQGLLAWVLILQGKPKEALEPATKAHELDEINFSWSNNLGHVHLLTGEERKAHDYYLEAVKQVKEKAEYEAMLDDFKLFIQNGWKVEENKRAIAWVEKLYANLDDLRRIDALSAQVDQAKADNDLNQAVALRQQMRPLAEKCYGKPSRYLADLLHKQADDLETLNRDQEALALYPEALAMREASYGKEHLRTVNTLNNYAFQYKKMGQYQQALPLYRQALEIDRKALGESHPEYATDLNNLAGLYKSMGDYAQALPLYRQALEIRKQALGEEHPDYTVSLNNLASLYFTMSDYAQALPLYRQALEIRKKTLGEEHPDYAQSLNNLAELYRVMGDYAQALPLYRQALEIRKKTLGEEHPAYAQSLNNLAALYYAMGDYAQALPLFRQALEIWKKSLGEEHPDYATSLNNLAGLYKSMGDYAQALPLYRQALEIDRKTLGESHPEYATDLNNLASLFESMGDYAQALPLYRQALAIKKQALGEEHPAYATSLNNLALLYESMGDYAQALPLYRQALEIRKQALGEEHPAYATSLNNLALLYKSMGDYAQALPLFRQALEINKQAIGEEHPAYATSLNNLALLYYAMGDYAQALPLFRQTLEIWKKSLGEEHPDYAQSLNNLAFAYGGTGKTGEALAGFVQSEKITDGVIQRTFSVMSEQQRLQFVQQQEGGYHGLLSLVSSKLAGNREAVRAGLDAVLSRKGIVFDAQARQQDAIARSLDPETKKLWDELSNQRAMLAKLMQNKPEKMSGEDYQKRIADYQSAITKLEGQLASKSALIAQDLKQRQITSKEVAAQLGKDGVLIEYTKLQDYDWEHGKWADTWRYLAFILHGDGKIQMIDLGEADKLESTVQAALKPIGIVGRDTGQQQQATRALHQTLWQPISAAVGEASKVVFSPDGLLNLVPFAAQQDADGRYLIESRQISYVTSGRDLTKGDLGIKPESELYLAANPQFDLAATTTKAAATDEPTQGAVRSAGFGIHFSPLPGTAKEAEQIPGYLNGKQTVLTDTQATEESVLAVRRPRVMHLSTHGFFLTDQAAVTQGTRGFTRVKAMVEEGAGKTAPVFAQGYENPLVRSGLAFAGANHASEAQGGRDGLLTALEVSGMDLHGTDLVTLSACETGRGEVKSGEGVFGLRRAFALAGTGHLMMSLWPVSDAVTATQMQTFYQLYGKRTAPAAALRQAQLATIAELRSKRGQAEPALWAPFIVQGW